MHACVFFYRAHIINNKKKEIENNHLFSAKKKPLVAI